MVKVSVIIPAFDAASTLAQTIDSVLEQSFQDFEILVIDDGSKDATVEQARSFADQRIRVFSYGNSGAAAARNRGIEQAKGEFITFLDADDLWSKDKLACQVEILQQNPQAGVAYSWTDYIDTNGQFLYPGTHNLDEGDVLIALFKGNFIENGSNLMVRKSALQEVGNFIPDLASVHDWELWLRLAEKFQFALVPKVQVFYRVMPSSISSNLVRQEKNTLKVIRETLARSSRVLEPHYRFSLSHLYRYLTFRTLSVGQTRWQYLRGLRFYGLAISYEPSLLLQRTKLMAIILGKILLGLILSPSMLKMALSRG